MTDEAGGTDRSPAKSHDSTEQTATQSQSAPPMSADTTADRTDRTDATRFRRLLEYALLATFVLVALFAALSFYSQVGRAVEVWVAAEYEPVAKAAVNLALLLVAVAGVSRQLARVAGRRSGAE